MANHSTDDRRVEAIGEAAEGNKEGYGEVVLVCLRACHCVDAVQILAKRWFAANGERSGYKSSRPERLTVMYSAVPHMVCTLHGPACGVASPHPAGKLGIDRRGCWSPRLRFLRGSILDLFTLIL